jgi:hypothetical protein
MHDPQPRRGKRFWDGYLESIKISLRACCMRRGVVAFRPYRDDALTAAEADFIVNQLSRASRVRSIELVDLKAKTFRAFIAYVPNGPFKGVYTIEEIADAMLTDVERDHVKRGKNRILRGSIETDEEMIARIDESTIERQRYLMPGNAFPNGDGSWTVYSSSWIDDDDCRRVSGALFTDKPSECLAFSKKH